MLTRVFDRVNSVMIDEHMNAINELSKEVPDLFEFSDVRDLIHFDVTAGAVADHVISTERDKPQARAIVLVRPNFALQYSMATAYVDFAQDTREAISIFDDVSAAVPWLFNGTQSDEVLKLIESSIESAAIAKA